MQLSWSFSLFCLLLVNFNLANVEGNGTTKDTVKSDASPFPNVVLTISTLFCITSEIVPTAT